MTEDGLSDQPQPAALRGLAPLLIDRQRGKRQRHDERHRKYNRIHAANLQPHDAKCNKYVTNMLRNVTVL